MFLGAQQRCVNILRTRGEVAYFWHAQKGGGCIFYESLTKFSIPSPSVLNSRSLMTKYTYKDMLDDVDNFIVGRQALKLSMGWKSVHIVVYKISTDLGLKHL